MFALTAERLVNAVGSYSDGELAPLAAACRNIAHVLQEEDEIGAKEEIEDIRDKKGIDGVIRGICKAVEVADEGRLDDADANVADEIALNCAICLAKLSEDGACDAAMAAAKAEATLLRLCTLREDEKPSAIQENALMGVKNLANDGHFEETFVQLGGIETVSSTLRRLKSDGDAAEVAVAALANLTTSRVHASLLAHADALPPIMAVLRNGTEDGKAGAVAVIRNLTLDDTGKVLAGRIGAAAHMVKVLSENVSSQEDESDAAIDAVGAIRNMSLAEENDALLLAAGCVNALLSAALKSTFADNAMHAVRNICAGELGAHAVLDADGARRIGMVLQQQRQRRQQRQPVERSRQAQPSSDCLKAAVYAVENMSLFLRDEDDEAALVVHGIVQQLVHLLSSKSTSIQDSCLLTLERLHGSEVCDAAVSSVGSPALLSMIAMRKRQATGKPSSDASSPPSSRGDVTTSATPMGKESAWLQTPGASGSPAERRRPARGVAFGSTVKKVS
eukprot:g2711.t1